jgi:sterol desaturase/sphingolipid hydroxylase (fatty acid hydroxylase superfamily)
MEKLIHYFETIPSAHRSLILAGGITFFYLIEYIIPLFEFKYKKWQHAVPNLVFTLTSIIVNFLLALLVMIPLVSWGKTNNFGLLFWLPSMPAWLFALLGLMLLDLIGAYFVHFVEHKVKWMWRFHLVHHTDVHVDTTSANRHHPGESVFRFIFTTIGAFIIGAPMWLIMLYQSVSVVLSQFNHANINIPKWLDNAMSWVLVSPDMHKVHHHYVQPYTDTNFGNIFSIWDRLFGTFATINKNELKYGIDTHMAENEHANLKNLMAIPFQEYRTPVGSKFTNEKI